MEKTESNLNSFRAFLGSIPLAEYRETLKNVKWVEQDLYPAMLPLASIFKNYWETQNFLDFESWFEQFWEELHSGPTSLSALKEFKKYYFDKNNDGWFKLGFKARMYRTWVSVLTQIDFYYAFQYVCAKRQKAIAFEANAELDRKGIDLIIGELEFGISKVSQRKEARSAGSKTKLIVLPYAVFNIGDFMRKSHSPRVSPANRIAYHNSVEAFNKYFIQLKNGFVVFGENYVNQLVDNIDNPEELIDAIGQIGKDLAGEA
ncbi:MAG: hypothetical protein DDT31_01588 [Syntrophomonadaceae bacterium]|nr:hypothetical protein [Bacillota bacterium]